MKLNIERTAFNETFFKLREVNTRFCLCFGGAASGKSYAMLQNIILWLLQPDCNIMIIRKYGNTIEHSVYDNIKHIFKFWQIEHFFKFYNTYQKREIHCKINNNKIIFKGFDDPENIKSLFGIKILFVEEASQLKMFDFLELNRRLRGIENIRIYFLLNPVSHLHCLKKLFVDTPILKKDTTIIHTTYKDNKFLTETDMQQLENLKFINENDYRIYTLGEWGVNTKLLVFLPEKWQVVESIPKEAKRIPYGLDFGFVNAPTALIECFLHNGELWLNELIYETGLVNVENELNYKSIIQRFKELVIDKQQYIIADSAEKKSIEELKIAGYYVLPCKKYAGCIRDRIKLLQNYKINITANSLNLIDEFNNYKYKEDKNGNILDDPEDIFNHGIDAVGYVIQKKNQLF